MPSTSQRSRRKARRNGTRNRLTRIQVDEISLVDNPAVPEAEFVIAKRLAEGEEVAEELAKDESADADQDTDGGGDEIAKVDGDGDGSQEVELAKSRKAVGRAFVTAIQALRQAAGEMDAASLHALANLMDHARWAFAEIPAVANELDKCDDLDMEAVDEGLQQSPVYKAIEDLLQQYTLAKEGDAAAATDGGDPTPDAAATTPAATEVAKDGDEEAATDGGTAEPGDGGEPVRKEEAGTPPSVLDEVGELLAKRRAERAAKQASEIEAEAMQLMQQVAKRVADLSAQSEKLSEKFNKAAGRSSD